MAQAIGETDAVVLIEHGGGNQNLVEDLKRKLVNVHSYDSVAVFGDNEIDLDSETALLCVATMMLLLLKNVTTQRIFDVDVDDVCSG